MVSGSQLFHISSFPNALASGIQKHHRTDPSTLLAESFLTGTDFVKMGWPTVVTALFVTSGVTFGIVTAMKL
jgi:phosphate transporter